MTKKDILGRMPRKGFLKLSVDKADSLEPQQKAALVRKGNELFNKGLYDQAKRIFLTAGYTDGLIRMGDYYFSNQQPLEAFRMYKIAPAEDKVEHLVEQMAGVISNWLQE